jgi:Cu2+-exporting ATPase
MRSIHRCCAFHNAPQNTRAKPTKLLLGAAACSRAGSFTPDEDQEQQPLLQTVVLDVGGMKCGGCSAAVKSMLLKHPGVQGAAVNLLTESAAVTVRCGHWRDMKTLPEYG